MVRSTVETREKVVHLVFANPLTENAIGSHDVLFRPIVDQALLTVEDLPGETGKRLETQFPREGWAAAEIAPYQANAGNWDAALPIPRSPQGASPASPFAMPLLLEAKRDAEAARVIAEMAARVESISQFARKRRAKCIVQ